MSEPRTIVVLQPGYLPWLGFFDQVRRADAFVVYDDVQFDKNGWRNRNRIKSANGPQWLTVPVLQRGRSKQALVDVEINAEVPWARRHLASIRQNYARAPFLDHYLPELEELLMRPWKRLVDLDLELAERMCGWLGIACEWVRSSELGIEGDRVGRLIAICETLGAERYLSGDAARDYLDETAFAARSIEVSYQEYSHPTYPQLHGDFESNLSALDLLFNCGGESGQILRG